jgi:hypothetical protein
LRVSYLNRLQRHMVDPLILSHRELRAALHLAERELKKTTLTPRRARLLTSIGRTLDNGKIAAVSAGISKMPAAMQDSQ